MKFSIILLSLFILVGSPLEATFAKEDPALRKQRQEAKKERHQQKRDRGTELTEARRSLQDFARSQKSNYTQQLQDLDVDFELKEVELTANRDRMWGQFAFFIIKVRMSAAAEAIVWQTS